VALVGEPDPADVEAVAGSGVEPAEAQTRLHGLELGEPVLVHDREHVPLAAVLVGARSSPAEDLLEARPSLLPKLVEPRVQHAHLGLLPLDLRISRHLTSLHLGGGVLGWAVRHARNPKSPSCFTGVTYG